MMAAVDQGHKGAPSRMPLAKNVQPPLGGTPEPPNM